MVSRLGRLALMLLACALASASEMAQLDDHTDSATIQTLQGDGKEDWKLKHSDAVASDAEAAGDEIRRKEAFLLDGLEGMKPVVHIDPMQQPTAEENEQNEQAGEVLLRDKKDQCTPLIHFLHAQAAHNAKMIFTDRALYKHVKFDMGDIWAKKMEAIVQAIQMNERGVPGVKEDPTSEDQDTDLGESHLDDPSMTALEQAEIKADDDDTREQADARMRSSHNSADADLDSEAEGVEHPTGQLQVEKALLAAGDPEDDGRNSKVTAASEDATQWEFKAEANYRFMLALAKSGAGSDEQRKHGAQQKAAQDAAKARQAQTWPEKQRLCDAVLPTITDQVSQGAEYLLSDYALFTMAKNMVGAGDLAKIKSCVGALPEDQMVVPLGADASTTAPEAVGTSGAQWLRALASKRFAKELSQEMDETDEKDVESLAAMLVKQGIRSISAMETAPADVWNDVPDKLRVKLRAVVEAQAP